MKTLVCILGAGGHTRSLIPVIEENGFEIFGIYDNSFNPAAEELILGYPLKGKLDDIPTNAKIILSIGDCKKRSEIYNELSSRLELDNLIHRTAFIDKRASLGNSNQILGNAFINAGAIISNNNIINTGAIIEHEVRLGSHCHISIGSVLGGRVNVGNNCFIGAGATVIDNISICDGVTIGANSTVIRNIDEAGIYVGSPARKAK